ncbi:hypothetical protein JFQ93_003010 [Aeromonas sobria]|nr:hypothetical protein [Aeromonas sobria]
MQGNMEAKIINSVRECKLSLRRKNEISVVVDSTFYVFNENCSLYLYGKSLDLWLSIGGIVKGDIQIIWENNRPYYQGLLSTDVFFRFIYDQNRIFDVSDFIFGYKIKIKASDLNDYI